MNIVELEGEEWRPIPIQGYPNYLISNYGRVYTKNYHRLMRLALRKKGYLKAQMTSNDVQRAYFIHRLVALAFIPNPNNYPQVNHIDSNPANNHVSNLEWCTNKMNSDHCSQMGRRKPCEGEKNGSCLLTEKKVLKIREKFKRGFTRRMLGDEFGVSPATVKDIVLRRSWKHI